MPILLLLLLLAFTRRRLAYWEEAVPLALGLLQVSLLVITNLACRLAGWWQAPLALALVILLGTVALLRSQNAALPAFPADRRIYVLSILCVLAAWLGQGLVHDDDYGAHGGMQGQFLRGEFPQRNPYFPEVELHGHYGNDLLVATWARYTGFALMTAQFLSTLLNQALLPVLAYWALYRWSEERTSSFWGSFFMTLGVRVGGRAGFFDTYQNNNPLAQLYLVLVLYFFCRAWRYRRWTEVLLFAIVLGGYAVVYETQFGLACLACLAGFLIGLRWSPEPARLLAQGAVTILVTLSLAFTQGGPLTDLAHRKLSGQQSVGDRSHRAESQQVELEFPKKRLWHILSAQDRPATVEAVSDDAWIYRANQLQAGPQDGYRPFWDRSILGLHHFPLFLSPLLLYHALRRRDVCSLWLLAFGIIGFFVPAVVGFGDYYESEWFRWEYAAGLPLAGAMGVWISPYLEFRGHWLKKTAVVALLLFCSSNAWSTLYNLTRQSGARWSQGLSIYPGAHRFITSQPQFFCGPDDWRALQRLRRLSQPGQRVLVNSPDELWPNINFGSTLAGLTGLFPSGNRKPLSSDVGGQWPFHLRADTRAFWKCGDLRLLEMSPVDWLYWRDDAAFYPAVWPGHIGGVEWKPFGPRRLGRVMRAWKRWPWQKTARPLPFQASLQVNEHVRSVSCYPVIWQLNTPAPSEGRLLVKVGDDPQDWLLFPVLAGATEGKAVLAVPHREGGVAVTFAWVDGDGAHTLEGVQRLQLDFPLRLAQMELISVTTNGRPRAGHWLRLTSRWRSLQLSHEPDLELRGALAAIQMPDGGKSLQALQPGTGPGLAASVPHTSQQRLRFEPTGQADQWEVRAWTRLPDAPGVYRFDWFFAPAYACGVRRRGLALEVHR